MADGRTGEPETGRERDLAGALARLVEQAAEDRSGGAPGPGVLERLGQVFSPAVCRRLGVYDWPENFLLSIILPAFNEAATVERVVERIDSVGVPYEIIAVDDASTDGTGEILDRLSRRYPLRVIHHAHNQGKGAAIRSAIGQLRGQVVLIQDADLEYDPHEYPLLLGPIVEGRADVVFGSRFSSNDRPVPRYWHQTANRLVTLLSNMCTNLKLTDVETGYKVMRRELAERIGPQLREKGFGIELEITARLAKMKGVRFYELPISYTPRGYAEGKKIGWRDAVRALWCVVRYRIAA
jgi:glycosyltransferase involved in cell wall biosynthesis